MLQSLFLSIVLLSLENIFLLGIQSFSYSCLLPLHPDHSLATRKHTQQTGPNSFSPLSFTHVIPSVQNALLCSSPSYPCQFSISLPFVISPIHISRHTTSWKCYSCTTVQEAARCNSQASQSILQSLFFLIFIQQLMLQMKDLLLYFLLCPLRIQHSAWKKTDIKSMLAEWILR